MDRQQMNEALGMSEEELDLLGQTYESDTWDSTEMGKVVHGRPRLADEETRAITVRLPISVIAQLDGVAKSNGQTRSAAMRSALGDWLKKASAL